jgi:hypothetical protein
VRSIKVSISADSIRKLANRMDGEVVNADDY